MSLVPGTRVGAYEILSPLGAGGMGEVYRARDPKLGRDVALKILPESFVHDSERVARFRREARVLASLNHPHIAAIYGFEETHDSQFLVLELVEGETLAERLRAGPLPVDEAFAVAHQIADALEAAHEKGIIHRDLKPANIAFTPNGQVKVLDFGLAKALDPVATSDAANSPTLTLAATHTGVLLGTAAYMAPEQARGKAVDRRADVWAFGCVLYEMLTGRQAFRGETITDVLASVVNGRPDWSRVPPRGRRLLQACLEKDPQRRLQAIGDAWLLIEEDVQAPKATRRTSWVSTLVWLSTTAAAIATTMWIMAARQPVADERPLQVHVNPPDGVRLQDGVAGGSAVSPDGRAIVFAATSGGRRKLWIRRLESIATRELSGTEGADFPFWAPDGRAVGFFADNKLKRIDISGGPPLVVAEAPVGRGGTWGPDGTIVFAGSIGPLMRVAATGGTPTPLTKLDLANGENTHRWPQFLPGGRRLLYWVRTGKSNRTGTYLSSLDHPADKTLVAQSSTAEAMYSPGAGKAAGYLLWARDGELVAQPFDPQRGLLFGETTPIAGTEGIGISNALQRASFSISNEGTLVFTRAEDSFELAWFDREGHVIGSVAKPERYTAVRLSPTGNRVAMTLYDSSIHRDLWTMETVRGLPNRLTDDGAWVAVWSPDGRRLAYHDASQTRLFTISADGSDRQPMLESQEPVYINDWSPDGQWLLYTKVSLTTLNDLWLLSATGDHKPVPFLVTPFNESHGQFSPDGKWIAFTSDESGQQEIYIRSVAARERARASTSGGSFARWRADGKELFYRSLDGRLMAVPVSGGAGRPELGRPAALIDIVEPLGTYAYPYDVAPDGQKILTLKPAGSERNAATLTVIVKWDAGLKK